MSLVAPLTVCFFGPLETYCGNIGEFTFALGDFLPYVAAMSAIAAAIIFSLLMALDGRAFDVASAVILSITALTFAQKYYLNLGVNALSGDGVGVTEVGPFATVLNAAIWAIVIVGAVTASLILKKQKNAMFFVVAAFILMAILVTQLVGFVALSTDLGDEATDDAVTDQDVGQREPSVLTYENLNELSSGNNVVFFLIDRFDVRYFEKLQKTEPELLEGLDGFTFYNDYTSLYCRTYPAIASILTGMENDFEDSRLSFFKEIYENGGHLRKLHDAGYDINVYTEKYYAYDDAYYMREYVGNMSGVVDYEIDSSLALSGDMLRLSLSTCLPFVAKGVVGYMSTPDFNAHAVYEVDDPLYDADMKNQAMVCFEPPSVDQRIVNQYQ